MNLFDKVTETLKNNKIVYFQGNAENKNILSLPYSGIDFPEEIINVYMEIMESPNIIRFSTYRTLNGVADNAELKSKLLDINSSLTVGAYALESDSNQIEYITNYTVNENDFSFKMYNYYAAQCVKAYERLKKMNIE